MIKESSKLSVSCSCLPPTNWWCLRAKYKTMMSLSASDRRPSSSSNNVWYFNEFNDLIREIRRAWRKVKPSSHWWHFYGTPHSVFSDNGTKLPALEINFPPNSRKYCYVEFNYFNLNGLSSKKEIYSTLCYRKNYVLIWLIGKCFIISHSRVVLFCDKL